MKCHIKGHESFESTGICLDTDCQFETRLVCTKCLFSTHKVHMDSIILINDIIDHQQADSDYIKSCPSIPFLEDACNVIEEAKEIQINFDEVSKKIETNTSLMYDLILANYDTLNQTIRAELEVAIKIDLENLTKKVESLNEMNLFSSTQLFLTKQISSNEFENKINDSTIQSLRDIKSSLSKMSGRNTATASKNKTIKMEQVDAMLKRFSDMYIQMKLDINTLFSKYTSKSQAIIKSINTGSQCFQFIPTNYDRSITIDQIRLDDDWYQIKSKNLCLIGDRPLTGSVEKWKLVFQKSGSFSCVGFGIGSMDDPKVMSDSLSGNSNNVLLCLCCNGPWSAKSMKVVNVNQKLGERLTSENKKELTFELNRVEDKFRIYDPNNNIHAEYPLSSMPFKDNIVPIINATSAVNICFKIEDSY